MHRHDHRRAHAAKRGVGRERRRDRDVWGRTSATIEYCRELLEALGGPPDRIREVSSGGSAHVPIDAVPHAAVDDGAGHPTSGLLPTAAEAIIELARVYSAPPDTAVTHGASPLGVVHVDPAVCTACGACGTACPTGALRLEQDGDGIELLFDPARCTACGLCAGRCPEAQDEALTVRRTTDLAVLRRGAVPLFQDRAARCERCGAAIGPTAMVSRVRALLDGEANEATLAAITQRCTSCRAGGVTSRARATSDSD
jgi:ferredoxin